MSLFRGSLFQTDERLYFRVVITNKLYANWTSIIFYDARTLHLEVTNYFEQAVSEQVMLVKWHQ